MEQDRMSTTICKTEAGERKKEEEDQERDRELMQGCNESQRLMH